MHLRAQQGETGGVGILDARNRSLVSQIRVRFRRVSSTLEAMYDLETDDGLSIGQPLVITTETSTKSSIPSIPSIWSMPGIFKRRTAPTPEAAS